MQDNLHSVWTLYYTEKYISMYKNRLHICISNHKYGRLGWICIKYLLRCILTRGNATPPWIRSTCHTMFICELWMIFCSLLLAIFPFLFWKKKKTELLKRIYDFGLNNFIEQWQEIVNTQRLRSDAQLCSIVVVNVERWLIRCWRSIDEHAFHTHFQFPYQISPSSISVLWFSWLIERVKVIFFFFWRFQWLKNWMRSKCTSN